MDIYTAIAEPTRRAILEMLAVNTSLAASDIYKRFDSSAPAISQHLKALREAKLVRVEKRAQKRIYYVNPGPMTELERWVKRFTADWQERHDALEALLATEKSKQNQSNKEKL
jgi:DNA-binding transcriptional ArsR family regulator